MLAFKNYACYKCGRQIQKGSFYSRSMKRPLHDACKRVPYLARMEQTCKRCEMQITVGSPIKKLNGGWTHVLCQPKPVAKSQRKSRAEQETEKALAFWEALYTKAGRRN